MAELLLFPTLCTYPERVLPSFPDSLLATFRPILLLAVYQFVGKSNGYGMERQFVASNSRGIDLFAPQSIEASLASRSFCKASTRRESICKESIRKESICKESIRKESICKESIRQKSIRKGSTRKESTHKGSSSSKERMEESGRREQTPRLVGGLVRIIQAHRTT